MSMKNEILRTRIAGALTWSGGPRTIREIAEEIGESRVKVDSMIRRMAKEDDDIVKSIRVRETTWTFKAHAPEDTEEAWEAVRKELNEKRYAPTPGRPMVERLRHAGGLVLLALDVLRGRVDG